MLQLFTTFCISIFDPCTAHERIAFSVGLPEISISETELGMYTLPVVFRATPSWIKLRTYGDIDEKASSATGSSPNQNLVTFISFMVRVPVLSVQMTVAEPMVSQAESFLTIALSTIILFME
ncbi:hypothetical protein GBA52_005532 [Prunus armeniaca]|nr:hypothetical protein GBA52_005532 [Prunus armeniaca]